MDSLFYIAAVTGSILCYLCTIKIAAGDEGGGFGQGLWSNRPAMILLALGTLACLARGLGTVNAVFLGLPGGAYFGAVFSVVFGVALFVGPARLLLILLLEHLGAGVLDGLFAGSGSKFKGRRECDRAQAAERQGDLDAAERFYREEMTGTPGEDLFMHLGLGNLYHRQERYAEARAEWEAALAGGLPPELDLTTALRLSEILTQHLNEPDRAVTALEAALKRHPRQAESPALEKRLAALRKRGRTAPSTTQEEGCR